MKKYESVAKNRFLNEFPTCSLDSSDNEITSRCKFNFSYFHPVKPAQDFQDWTKEQLEDLLNKIKEYSKHPLSYWRNQSSGRLFTVYEEYPKNTDFPRPRHVPLEAQWARFRLESKIRLVGFIIPGNLNTKIHPVTKCNFDCNTFYVVFLDANHQFYKTEKK